MHEKLRDSLSQLCRSKASASSAKIIYSNLANDIVRSVKTTAPDLNNKIQWCFHIGEAQKKFKFQLNSSRNCSVCIGITFDEMKSSFARFNHVCFQFRRRIARAKC